MPIKTELVHKRIEVNGDERETFLAKNSMPGGDIEGYIWFSFENAENGYAYLYHDELETAAAMARRAGLEDLAVRIEEGGSDAIP